LVYVFHNWLEQGLKTLFFYYKNCIFDSMIGVYFLWQRLINYGQKYQLASLSVDEFNSNLAEVQLEAMTMLGPKYQSNELVRSLLAPWVRRIYDTSDQNGQIQQPQRVGVEEQTTETFYRMVGMGVTDTNGNLLFGISPTMEAEIVEMQRIPQRKPDLTKSRAYYINYDDVIQLYPQQNISFILWYLVYATMAKLAFTYTLVNGEYIQQYDAINSVDLQWDENATNLLIYLLLEKYGISSRDDLLQEYGKLGIEISTQMPIAK
jgi:hypothetical protein